MEKPPDYRPFLYATAITPLGMAVFSDASQMLPCIAAFIGCALIFLIRYFQALRATRQNLVKFLGPLVAIILLVTNIGLIGAAVGLLFIWGMAVMELKRAVWDEEK